MALEKTYINKIKKGSKSKVILKLLLYGVPYKIEEIHSIDNRYEIPIFEDSA